MECVNYFIATLAKNNVSASVIRKYLVNAWGEDNVKSLRRIQTIAKEFNDGDRESVKRKAGSGRPSTVCTDENIQRVAELLDNDNTSSISFIADELSLSEKSVHRILTKKLGKKSLYARWVPHSLSDAQLEERVTCANRLLEDMNGNVIITDEKWLYSQPLPPRQHVRQWVDGQGDRPRLARRIISDRKFHIIVGVSFRGDYTFQVLERDQTINADRYIAFIQERVMPLRRNLTLMHDNATPHSAIRTRNFCQENNIELLRQAPYSPDFNLLDRFVFRNLEFERRGTTFNRKEEVEEFLQNFMTQKMTRGKLQRELQRFRDDLHQIIAIGGDYL